MEKFEFQISEEMSNFLERFRYDTEVRKDIIALMFEKVKNDDNDDLIYSKSFLSYTKQLEELKVKYEQALREVCDRYVPDNLKEDKIRWYPNYETMSLIGIRCEGSKVDCGGCK